MSKDSPSPLAQFARRLRDEPERASVTFRASTDLREGYRCEARLRGHSVIVDEPASIGGTNEGPNPIELFLGSVATCQAITYRVWADTLGIELAHVSVEVEGDVDLRPLFGVEESASPGYSEIRLRVAVDGPEPDARYEELARAVEHACPLLDTLRRPIEVAVSTTIGARDRHPEAAS